MIEFLKILEELILAVAALLTNFNSRLNVLYLYSAIVIAYIIYLHHPKDKQHNFIRYLVPLDIWRHASHLTDIKLMLIGVLLKFLGLFSFIAMASVAALYVIQLFTMTTVEPPQISTSQILFITLMFALVSDFCTYWVHRLHHTNRFLWPFHKVHHSAEVMTPITMYRKHPLYDLFNLTVKAIASGLLQGLLIVLLDLPSNILVIGGANAVYFAFNILGANLRHTHIWFSYGRILNHILISPAQHQIHHSCSPQHIDTNFGEIFAIWDWLFGSLYVPQGPERFKLGLSAWNNAPVEQPHQNLYQALTVPFVECYQELQKKHPPINNSRT